jgi:curved DNA-binding protein CbpA
MHKLKQHPDLGGEHWNAVILNEAYEILSDSNKRAEYDKRLFEHYAKKPIPDKNSIRKPSISIFCPFCKRPLAHKAKPGEKCPSCRSPLQSKNTGEALTHDYHRSADRIKKSGTLRYYSSWPQKGKEAILLDLSPKGIRFLCNEELEQESIIKLSSHLLKAIAKVVNTQREEVSMKTSYTIGAHFITVTFANPKGSFFSSIV